MDGRYTIFLLAEGKNLELVSSLRDKLSDLARIPKTPPHITLREDFFSKNIDGFIDEYIQKIKGISPFIVEFSGVDVFQRGHVVFKVVNNSSLQRLHEITVELSQKYVSVPRVREFECELNEEQKVLAEKYQLPFYFKYYNPHMTIVQLSDFGVREKVLNEIKKAHSPASFLVENVCIYDKLTKDVYKFVKL